MKPCTVCNKVQDYTQFHISKRAKDGRQCICKECSKVYNKAHSKACPLRRAKEQQRRMEIPDLRLRKKEDSLKFHYKINLKEYQRLLAEQKECCKICNKHKSEFKRSLHVDHCHETGKVRGLLCTKCNSAIGMAEDDVSRLDAAKNYLLATRGDA